MNRYEQEMLTFAINWAPYGGGDENIFPEFGLPPRVFYERLSDLLRRRFIVDLEDGARQQLQELCATKLAQYSRSKFTPSQRCLRQVGDSLLRGEVRREVGKHDRQGTPPE